MRADALGADGREAESKLMDKGRAVGAFTVVEAPTAELAPVRHGRTPAVGGSVLGLVLVALARPLRPHDADELAVKGCSALRAMALLYH